MTDINVALLQKVLDYGTAACVAGHAVAMSGHIIDWDRSSSWPFAIRCNNGSDYIPEVAEKELGLSNDQAGELFASENTLEQLWLMASVFTKGAIEIPAGVVA